MPPHKILWADDEIDLLTPHIIFLEQKGYKISPVVSGADALERCKTDTFDVVFLDENMPGMTGLETLSQIKTLRPNLPVVMITKSEEEKIMEQAIGSKISDYLIKPLNPNQILLSVKKIIENKRLVAEKTNQGYRQEFRQISMAYNDSVSFADWVEIYKKLIFWEIELDQTASKEMQEVLEMQKNEANAEFCKFIMRNYENWFTDSNTEKPLFSHMLLKKKVFPLLQETDPVFFVLIDNLRYDQWKTIEPHVLENYKITDDSTYCAILPTTTEYARNAIFAGLMPSEIEKLHNDLWWKDEDEAGHNQHEEKLLQANLKRNQLASIKWSYHKILNAQQGKSLNDMCSNLLENKLNAIVYNFVDMLSHARTEAHMIKELAPDESAYRSITRSWFQHSTLKLLLDKLAQHSVKVVITTDHGTIRVQKATKVVGDRETNTNLRYKTGKNLTFDEKETFFTRKPERMYLPKKHLTTSYVFAKENYFLAYPNNLNYYVNYYKDTFQHGGISLEEMVIPFVVLEPRKQ